MSENGQIEELSRDISATFELRAHVFDGQTEVVIEREGYSVEEVFEQINRCGLTDGEERWWPTHQIQRIDWRVK